MSLLRVSVLNIACRIQTKDAYHSTTTKQKMLICHLLTIRQQSHCASNLSLILILFAETRSRCCRRARTCNHCKHLNVLEWKGVCLLPQQHLWATHKALAIGVRLFCVSRERGVRHRLDCRVRLCYCRQLGLLLCRRCHRGRSRVLNEFCDVSCVRTMSQNEEIVVWLRQWVQGIVLWVDGVAVQSTGGSVDLVILKERWLRVR